MSGQAAAPELIADLYGHSPPSGGRGMQVLGLQADVERLAEGVLTVLDRLGITCPNPDILAKLAAAGARADDQTGRATFPREMVLESVEHWRREAACERGASEARFRAPAPQGIMHQLAIYAYDWARRERRPGNRHDFIELTKLADVMHPEQGSGHCLLLSDVPPAVEPLEAAILLCQYSRRPAGVVVTNVRQIPYVREIEEMAGIGGPYWHWVANVSFATPLRLSREAAELFVYLVRSGDYPAKVYNFGVSGASMPVTAAGSAVLAAAEIVALWIAARALSPHVRLGGSMIQIGTLDMSGGDVSWWAFDGMIRSFLACEFIERWTGLAISPGGGEYTPSKVPGAYVALEKAYRAMAVAAFTGHHPGVGSGHLEAGLTFSPVQLILDREVTAALAFLETPVVDGDSIGLEAVLPVGHGEAGSYLETEHTLRHFRHALWQPACLPRGGWRGLAEEEATLDRAQRQVDGFLAQYEPPEFDPARLARMRAVVERARSALAQ